MLGWLSNMWALHWGCVIGILGLAGAVLLMAHQERLHAKERRRDRRIREEFEAYAHLDVRITGDDVRGLAKRVCRLVARKSAFQRVAMLVEDAEGRMSVVASVGMEEFTVQALNAWAERVEEEDGRNTQEGGAGIRVGEASFAVVLEKDSVGMGCGRAIMVPLWTSAGEMRGTLAVCADRLMTLRHRTVEETISPLETLGAKLGRALESAGLSEQLLQAEKLAGLGLMASGVAQALMHPLTAVLGFAELIEKRSKEARVRSNAEAISHEARRMRQTVEELMSFERSGPRIDEPVEIASLVRELAVECEERLASRGVLLVVDADEDVPVVRGDGDRLREVLEYLLNNAAQAIASVSGVEREHEIRISVSADVASVQMIVSDSGPGFKEPGRIFDPFYPARRTGEGVGVGLSICYGIVREHGGEISAFNLHPYGAAVMVELPFVASLEQNFSGAVREVA